VTINIFNKEKNKKYIIQITDEQLKNDDYFQSIKIEYNVLELFGLSNIELFMILIDNSIKKNTYSISWFKMTPLNIRNDTINFNIVISPSVELSFTLEFAGYI
jgi:hypothetical protein